MRIVLSTVCYVIVLHICFAQNMTPLQVKDINPGSGDSFGEVDPEFHFLNGILYFFADDSISGRELWRSDGTENGTYLVKDINPGEESSNPEYLNSLNGELFFTADDGVSGSELWRSDGTEIGTDLLYEFVNGFQGGRPRRYGKFNNELYFSALNLSVGTELYKTNGTSNGTVLVKDINEGSNGSNPALFIEYNNKLYFAAYNSSFGNEIFVTDGTENGTELFVDIQPGPGNAGPRHFYRGLNRLIFTASSTSNERNPWITDGTQNGTYRISNIAGDSVQIAYSAWYYEFKNKIYFESNRELYVTDGTANGTEVLFDDLKLNILQPFETQTTELNGNIIFPGLISIFEGGAELWISDGTTEGTRVLKDILEGFASSNPYYLTKIGDKIYFAATSLEHGRELWVTDGTEDGTQLYADINPGEEGSDPEYLFNVGNVLYFVADDGISGRELWKLDIITSTNEKEIIDQAIEVYPNPVRSSRDIHISSPNYLINAITLYNPNGTVIFNRANISSNTYNLPTTSLQPGVYFCRINTKAGVVPKKIVIH